MNNDNYSGTIHEFQSFQIFSIKELHFPKYYYCYYYSKLLLFSPYPLHISYFSTTKVLPIRHPFPQTYNHNEKSNIRYGFLFTYRFQTRNFQSLLRKKKKKKNSHRERVNIDIKHSIPSDFLVPWQSHPHIVSFSTHWQFQNPFSPLFSRNTCDTDVDRSQELDVCVPKRIPKRKQQISGPSRAILFTILSITCCRCYPFFFFFKRIRARSLWHVSLFSMYTLVRKYDYLCPIMEK